MFNDHCILLFPLVFACWVAAERCSDASTCKNTMCATAATHVHVECVDRHCSCVLDPLRKLNQISDGLILNLFNEFNKFL